MPFKIIRNDITKVHADAIVNTANPDPTYGAGTDSAIYRAAGEKKLLAERRRIGRLGVGEAAVTPAFNLKAKYIIHTVGPVWVDGEHREFELLASCYRKSLQIARRLHCRSIAFPLISTGTYGFPREKALNIALDQISSFLEEEEMDVTLVVFDRKTFELSSELRKDVSQYIDEHYVENRLRKEYSGQYPGRRQGGSDHILEYLRSRRRADKSSQELSADKSPRELSADKAPQEMSADREQIPVPAMDTGEVPDIFLEESPEEYSAIFPAPSGSGSDRELSFSEEPKGTYPDRPEPGGTYPDRPEPGSAYPEGSEPGDAYPDRPEPGDAYPEESEETAPEAVHPQDAQADESEIFYSRKSGSEDLYPGAGNSDQSPSGSPRDSAEHMARVDAYSRPAGKRPSKKPFLKEERRVESGSSVHRRSLQDVISHMGESFQECLLRMIDERGLTDAQVYKRANLDRKLFSKIRCNPNYSPSRRTVIALAIALELNMDEAVDLLRRAGMALSPGNKFDLIISYCIQNGIYDIYKVNALLFDYDLPLLGAV